MLYQEIFQMEVADLNKGHILCTYYCLLWGAIFEKKYKVCFEQIIRGWF